MQITQEQYEKIAKYLPKQRGNVSMTNLQLINAILCICRSNCAAKPAKLSIDSVGIEQWFRANWAGLPRKLNNDSEKGG